MRLRLPLLVSACLLGAPAVLLAQDGDRDRRSAIQIADSAGIAGLARSLVEGAASDSARASVLYDWVARNVRYDAASFFRGRDGYDQAEEVYRHRIALCGGYVARYQRLAREVGLETVRITGYAKGVDYEVGQSTRKPNHAWLAMHIGGEWRLIDPTWGAGVLSGRTFEPRFTRDYFLVSPDELILSHFPEEPQWQLVDAPLTRRQFERMRIVPRNLLGAGFSVESIRAAALTPGVTDFPLTGVMAQGVRVIHAPVSGSLPARSNVVIEVEWPGAHEVALVTNGQWTVLGRSGDRFRGQAAAAGSTFQVVGRTGDDEASYQTLLHYRVVESRARASSR